MKVLIAGNYGREHALVWKLAQSPKVTEIFVAPGNAGTALIGKNVDAQSVPEIIAWLRGNKMDLVLIDSDNYLAEGLTDKIQELGIPVFGPTQEAAKLEWSKSFSKQFMREENIPAARFEVFVDF